MVHVPEQGWSHRFLSVRWWVISLEAFDEGPDSGMHRSRIIDSVREVEGAGPSTLPERRCHAANGIPNSRRYHGSRTLRRSTTLCVEVEGSVSHDKSPCQEQSLLVVGYRIEPGVGSQTPVDEEGSPPAQISVTSLESCFSFRIHDFAAIRITERAKDSIFGGNGRISKPDGMICE